MEKINWSPEYSVGVGKIDEQHKRLILMLNRLHDTIEATTSSEAIAELITQMLTYGQEHFKTEENLLAEHRFPLFDQHKLCHVNYRKKVADLCMASAIDVPEVPQVMLNFLTEWWRNHILKEDMTYKPFFNEKGIY